MKEEQTYIFPQEKVETLDEIKAKMEEINVTTDDLKDYYEKGYKPSKIGFL